MQLHVTSSFFTSSPQNCTGVFNAAEEAEVCSGPENYGRNPDPSRVRCIRRPVPYPPSGGREDNIHSVTNPTSKFTAAIHVYGGDLFASHRSEWDPETLSEQRFDGERARQIFEEANRRFVAGLG
jgi:predicted metal-dependent enzyme (double-stranded beta helix superfamily)